MKLTYQQILEVRWAISRLSQVEQQDRQFPVRDIGLSLSLFLGKIKYLLSPTITKIDKRNQEVQKQVIDLNKTKRDAPKEATPEQQAEVICSNEEVAAKVNTLVQDHQQWLETESVEIAISPAKWSILDEIKGHSPEPDVIAALGILFE